MTQKQVRFYAPVLLDSGCEVRHGKRFYTNRLQSHFLAFDNCRALTIKWVYKDAALVKAESSDVLPHQVRRERQDKRVPIMNWRIKRIEFAGLAVRLFGLRTDYVPGSKASDVTLIKARKSSIPWLWPFSKSPSTAPI